MGIFIGIVTACLLVCLFRLFEKNIRGKIRIAEICFLFMIVLLSSIYNPLSYPLQWAVLSLLFYAALDDLLTYSFRIELPIVSFIMFAFIHFDGTQFLWSIGIAVGIYLFSKMTKGAIIADGDAFIALPLAYFVTTHHLIPAMYISLLLGGIIFTFIALFTSKQTYPFIPSMVSGAVIAATQWHQGSIIFFGTILICICYVLLLWHKRKTQN